MEETQLIPHLFRTEYRKIVSVLCKTFGIELIEIAEDIASDTFLLAAETWSFKGLPANPIAWLYIVAKNKAKDYFKRDGIFKEKVRWQVESKLKNDVEIDVDLSEGNIKDSQLQMLFAICHPVISPEAQIGLALRILCGFGVEQIAEAFLTNKETINKRLLRAKEKLRGEKVKIEFPCKAEINQRLGTVLTTLYLLFNEGYYSTMKETLIRKDFCEEAMRLTYLLAENEQTDLPAVNALLALMCFHSSRFEARLNERGESVLYQDQDTDLWNKELIDKGNCFFNKAINSNTVTKYHLEAGIAYWHTQKTDSKEKWQSILQLYNYLLQLEYSPIAALNRTYALSKVYGKAKAIEEAEKLGLVNNQAYHALLGELYLDLDNEKAMMHLTRAASLLASGADKQIILKKIAAI